MAALVQATASFSGGHELDAAPESLGPLRDSSADLQELPTLRQRMAEEGYLYLPNVLDRQQVLAAREVMTHRLAAAGQLDPSHPPMAGRVLPDRKMTFRPDLAKDNPPLQQVLYGGTLMGFWERFLGGAVRHFDFTWVRAITPGHGTASHCDIVYMGRGTPNLYTAWTPLGDIDYELGGLMVLEGSNRHERLRQTYCRTDVDSYCTNRQGPAALDAWAKGQAGWLSRDPNQIRRSLGGRWLSGEYRAGDVLVFSVFTVHASLDNRSRNRLRLSSDSRYQRAREPADERWIGPNPIGHSLAGKRGRIC